MPVIKSLVLTLAQGSFESYHVLDKLKREESETGEVFQKLYRYDTDEECEDGDDNDNDNKEQVEEEKNEDDELFRIEEEEEDFYDEISPFFNFHLFPNLQRLDLIISHGGILPLNSSATEGLRSLQRLEYLHLDIGGVGRPIGTKFLFDGLLHLPLLKGFSLVLGFIKDDEHDMLTESLQQQTELISLSLFISQHRSTKDGLKNQNRFLENNLWECLNKKSRLKCLTVKSDQWSIESLSKSLKRTKLENQIQELELQLFDDNMTSSMRVEGLCEFLKKQKLSLRSLRFSLQLVYEDSIVDNLVRAISDLEELRILDLKINSDTEDFTIEKCEADFLKIFPNKIQKKKHLCFAQTFTKLEKALKKLHKLSELIIELNPIRNFPNDSHVNPFRILNAFPTLKGLKTAHCVLPFLQENIGKHQKDVLELLKMSNLVEVKLLDCNGNKVDKLEAVSNQVERKHSLRCDLMF